MSYSTKCLVRPTFFPSPVKTDPSFEDEAVRDAGHDLERHLGVLVDRWGVLNESESTPLPQIPEEIDFLWVVHRWEQGYDWLPTWVARRGETTWRVHAEVAT
jgi:hypothetical protein